MSIKEELQAAADSGKLGEQRVALANERWEKVVAQMTDRRWIVSKVVEIAVARGSMPPDEFGAFCEAIAEFISSSASDPASGK